MYIQYKKNGQSYGILMSTIACSKGVSNRDGPAGPWKVLPRIPFNSRQSIFTNLALFLVVKHPNCMTFIMVISNFNFENTEQPQLPQGHFPLPATSPHPTPPHPTPTQVTSIRWKVYIISLCNTFQTHKSVYLWILETTFVYSVLFIGDCVHYFPDFVKIVNIVSHYLKNKFQPDGPLSEKRS